LTPDGKVHVVGNGELLREVRLKRHLGKSQPNFRIDKKILNTPREGHRET
jgi:hypothetical protein